MKLVKQYTDKQQEPDWCKIARIFGDKPVKLYMDIYASEVQK